MRFSCSWKTSDPPQRLPDFVKFSFGGAIDTSSPFFSLYEHESAALAMQEQQAEDADDVEQLLQREMDAVSVNGGATPLSSLEADIQGTRAALLAALADDNQDDDSDAES
jgi:hypothetical protein